MSNVLDLRNKLGLAIHKPLLRKALMLCPTDLLVIGVTASGDIFGLDNFSDPAEALEAVKTYTRHLQIAVDAMNQYS